MQAHVPSVPGFNFVLRVAPMSIGTSRQGEGKPAKAGAAACQVKGRASDRKARSQVVTVAESRIAPCSPQVARAHLPLPLAALPPKQQGTKQASSFRFVNV